MSAEPSKCLTRAEFCALLSISPRTSRKMDRNGTGPKAIRVSPRVIRYPAAEVVNFMRSQGVTPPPELQQCA